MLLAAVEKQTSDIVLLLPQPPAAMQPSMPQAALLQNGSHLAAPAAGAPDQPQREPCEVLQQAAGRPVADHEGKELPAESEGQAHQLYKVTNEAVCPAVGVVDR